MKLKHSNNTQKHLYFNRIPRLWNSLPSFNIDLPLSTIKAQLCAYFRNHFSSNFDPNDVCTYHYQCPCHKCSILPISTHFNICLFHSFISIVCVCFCFVLAAGPVPSDLQHRLFHLNFLLSSLLLLFSVL